VPTAELFAPGLEHAANWWKARGQSLRLLDEASALARSAASDGMHYSFEKRDQVTCSTVFGVLLVSDVVQYRSELCSFSVDEAMVEARRDQMSSQQEEEAAMEQEAQRGRAEESAAAQRAREAAAASNDAERHARFEELRERRALGKERQSAREAEAEARRRQKKRPSQRTWSLMCILEEDSD